MAGRFHQALASGSFRLLLVVALAVHVAVERWGLFAMGPASWVEVLHGWPVRGLSLLVALNAVAGLGSGGGKGMRRAGGMLVHLSLVVLAAGLLTSIATRFEGEVVRAEGQTFNGFWEDFVPGTVHGRSRRMPQVGFTVLRVEPEAGPDVKSLKSVTAHVLLAGSATEGVEQEEIASSWPLMAGGTSLRVTDFGYAVRYVLSGAEGRSVESDTLNLHLFPPGAEDRFEPRQRGYLFYLRLHPDVIETAGDPASKSLVPRNPLYHVRIVRNKDVLYSGRLLPNEKLRFDSSILTLPEARMWVRVRVVRDPGVLVAAVGGALLVAGLLLPLWAARPFGDSQAS